MMALMAEAELVQFVLEWQAAALGARLRGAGFPFQGFVASSLLTLFADALAPPVGWWAWDAILTGGRDIAVYLCVAMLRRYEQLIMLAYDLEEIMTTVSKCKTDYEVHRWRLLLARVQKESPPADMLQIERCRFSEPAAHQVNGSGRGSGSVVPRGYAAQQTSGLRARSRSDAFEEGGSARGISKPDFPSRQRTLSESFASHFMPSPTSGSRDSAENEEHGECPAGGPEALLPEGQQAKAKASGGWLGLGGSRRRCGSDQ
jgi:hypothetical protein